jgi:hypothetical protein
MTIITTKFTVGETVYRPRVHTASQAVTCPDCNGTREWATTSAAGQTFKIDCPRCTSFQRFGYHEELPQLLRRVATAHVERLTIRSVRIDTAPMRPEYAEQYMCSETSSGATGSLYDADHLYLIHDEAMARAMAMATDEQQRIDAAPVAAMAAAFFTLPFRASLRLMSDYSVFNAWREADRFRDAITGAVGEGTESLTLETIREELQSALEAAAWRDPQPFRALIHASQHALTYLETGITGDIMDPPIHEQLRLALAKVTEATP